MTEFCSFIQNEKKAWSMWKKAFRRIQVQHSSIKIKGEGWYTSRKTCLRFLLSNTMMLCSRVSGFGVEAHTGSIKILCLNKRSMVYNGTKDKTGQEQFMPTDSKLNIVLLQHLLTVKIGRSLWESSKYSNLPRQWKWSWGTPEIKPSTLVWCIKMILGG